MDASVYYFPKNYLPNCVYLYLVPLLLHRSGNLFAYVALFVTSGCRSLSFRGRASSVLEFKSRGRWFQSDMLQSFTNLRLISIFFIISLYKAVLFVVFSLVFAKRIFASVCDICFAKSSFASVM